MSSERVEPDLSAILAVERAEQGRELIEVLRRRAREAAIELVLVGIGAEPAGDVDDSGFHSVTSLHAPGSTLAEARELGARRAAGPVVVVCETHSFPEEGWARGIVARIGEGWAAVGPVVRPFNPARRGVAATVFDYGRWMGGPEGAWPDLPGHNTAYRRDALLAALDEFPGGMDAETLMQSRIREAGGELYLDPGVVTHHMNMESFSGAAREWLVFARVFAARRAAGWSPLRRAIYAAGSPLLPLIRMPRFLAAARRSGHLRALFAGFDLFLIVLLASAAGELMGYATRRCDPAGTIHFELERRRWAPSAPPVPELASAREVQLSLSGGGGIRTPEPPSDG